jgi:hypothetical protein
LKTVAVWTLLPLLINPMETLSKHLIFCLDVYLTLTVFIRLDIQKDLKENIIGRCLVYTLFASVFMLQTWQVFFVDVYKQMHEGWRHRY